VELEDTRTIDPCPPDQATTDRLLGGAHHNPHGVLGAHPHPDGTVVRVLRPHADEVAVLRNGDPNDAHPLVKVHDAGLFSGVVEGPGGDYRVRVRYGDRVDIVDDPYRWLPTLGEMDLHLISEGRHERLWDVLGAHVRHYDTISGPVTGTSFAVWAPTAQGVRVTGDFDGWAGWAHPMRSLGTSGIWEIFLPDVGVGTRYKFRILGQDGRWRDKADPMAFATEIPPATASVVTDLHHRWGDDEWIAQRAQRTPHAEPMSVYELHLGSWRQGNGYREIADQLVEYLDETGFTHVELLPVAEHPFGGSWGYQVTSYYAPTSRFGTPDDFRYFVDRLHQAGYGVIVDWVPAHFPRDEWALAKFDGSPLYEHADPRRGEQPDWGTLVFDFGRKEVRNFLVANALYWIEEFHIDGLRVDAVASMLYLDYSRPEGQWLPNIHGGRENLEAVAFLQEMNGTVYRAHPGVVTIAEESTAWPGVTRPTYMGGLGFGMKWNMGWMHDTLDYFGRDPIHRAFHHNQLTFSLMYAFSENYVLPISHDEVVHGKGSMWTRMPGDDWNKAAGVRALLAFMWAHPGKQLVFMGGEFGQVREWSEQRSLDWDLLADPLHGGIKTLVGDLNRAYRDNPALWTKDNTPEGFAWIDANDAAGNVLSFLRFGSNDPAVDGRPNVLACIANFSGTPNEDYRVGLPFAGRWREVVNTDAGSYGGSGVGNLGVVEAEPVMWHGRPASAVLRLPPSGVLWLVPETTGGPVHPKGAAAGARASTQVAPASITSAPIASAPITSRPAPLPSGGQVPPPAVDPTPVDSEFASAHTPPAGFPAVSPESPAAGSAVPAEAEAETGSVPGTMFDDTVLFDDTVFDDEEDAEAATRSDATTADAPAATTPSSQVGVSMSDGAPVSEPSDPGTSAASEDPAGTGAHSPVETPDTPQSSGTGTHEAASPTEASTPDTPTGASTPDTTSEVATPDLVASDAPAASTADSPPAEALVEGIATDEDGGAVPPSGAGDSSEAEQPSEARQAPAASSEAEGPEGPRTTG
jgi:1,4-alpha-glucan branching enzyme